jgi:hypothetical protein
VFGPTALPGGVSSPWIPGSRGLQFGGRPGRGSAELGRNPPAVRRTRIGGVLPGLRRRSRYNLLLSVADRDNAIACDLEAGRASIWVTGTVAENPAFLRYRFLEAAACCLLDARHVVAIHAACVSREGRGVLLAGDSGAGKTSLAYACARRGWAYTSDDAAYLVRRGSGRRVLGHPRVFRFRESAGRVFPEFRGWRETRRGNGKPTIEVQTRDLPDIRTAWECPVDSIVFLNRAADTPRSVALEPVPPEEAIRRLWWNPWPAELPGENERRAALRRLSTAPAFEMTYRDLDAAVDKLELLARGGSQ